MSDLQNLDFCQQTLELKGVIESSFLSLGKRLLQIRDQQLYSPQWESFGEFCMEMKMSQSTISRLINIYEKFIITLDIKPQQLLEAGGWHSVAEILSIVKTREDALMWLDKATTLSREDLRTEIRIAKTGIVPEQCDHSESYTIRICKKCGDKEKIYDKEN